MQGLSGSQLAPGISCLHLLSAGVTGSCHTLLESPYLCAREFQPLHLHSTCVTHWAISLAQILHFNDKVRKKWQTETGKHTLRLRALWASVYPSGKLGGGTNGLYKLFLLNNSESSYNFQETILNKHSWIRLQKKKKKKSSRKSLHTTPSGLRTLPEDVRNVLAWPHRTDLDHEASESRKMNEHTENTQKLCGHSRRWRIRTWSSSVSVCFAKTCTVNHNPGRWNMS